MAIVSWLASSKSSDSITDSLLFYFEGHYMQGNKTTFVKFYGEKNRPISWFLIFIGKLTFEKL